MLALRITNILIATSLAGCSLHPVQEDVTDISTIAIVEKVRCEAQAAILRYDPSNKYAGAAIGYNFTFSVTENNNASGSVDFTIPLNPGSFRLGLSGGGSKQRKGERNFKVSDNFAQLRKLRCGMDVSRPSHHYPITGDIGLDEIIGNFISLAETSSKLSDFTDQIAFKTTVGASANPSVALLPAPGNFRNASLLLVADREDVHKLFVGLSLPLTEAERQALAASKIVKVQIVGGVPAPAERDGARKLGEAPSEGAAILRSSPPSGRALDEETRLRALRSIDRQRDLGTQERLLERLDELD